MGYSPFAPTSHSLVASTHPPLLRNDAAYNRGNRGFVVKVGLMAASPEGRPGRHDRRVQGRVGGAGRRARDRRGLVTEGWGRRDGQMVGKREGRLPRLKAQRGHTAASTGSRGC